MPIEYLRQLQDLSTCYITEMENLVVQLVLSVDENSKRRFTLQEDFRGICKTKVEYLMFLVKNNDDKLVATVKGWLNKFRELTEIDYEEILNDMRQKWEV